MADSNTDTLTFTAGTGISINANPTTDTISITNTSPNVNQNVFETFNGDSGSYIAASATDEFNIVGGTDISTSITGSTLTINYTGGGGGGGGSQNLFATVAGDSGSTTANTQTDTLTVAGGNDIATSIKGRDRYLSKNRSWDRWMEHYSGNSPTYNKVDLKVELWLLNSMSENKFGPFSFDICSGFKTTLAAKNI